MKIHSTNNNAKYSSIEYDDSIDQPEAIRDIMKQEKAYYSCSNQY
jgi:hypothetical protein